MSYSQQVREDATSAADYIREHGWCQHQWENASGSVCLKGAASKATDCDLLRHTPLIYALRETIGIPEGLSDWNDTPGRTKEEVLAVFDKIANK
jgi:hypothetical protein